LLQSNRNRRKVYGREEAERPIERPGDGLRPSPQRSFREKFTEILHPGRARLGAKFFYHQKKVEQHLEMVEMV
jgi:hypothetical protein